MNLCSHQFLSFEVDIIQSDYFSEIMTKFIHQIYIKQRNMHNIQNKKLIVTRMERALMLVKETAN